MRFIVRILGNALALYLCANFLDKFFFPDNWFLLLLAGLVLAVFNAILKPALKFLSAPLIFLTFGLFTILINIFILWLLTKFFLELRIEGLGAYFWGTIIISLTNWLISYLLKKKKPELQKTS